MAAGADEGILSLRYTHPLLSLPCHWLVGLDLGKDATGACQEWMPAASSPEPLHCLVALLSAQL